MCLNAILATGLTYVIILGGIDISVGSSMAITGYPGAQVDTGTEHSVYTADYGSPDSGWSGRRSPDWSLYWLAGSV